MTSTNETRRRRWENAEDRVARAWAALYAAQSELTAAGEAMFRHDEQPRDDITDLGDIQQHARDLGA